MTVMGLVLIMLGIGLVWMIKDGGKPGVDRPGVEKPGSLETETGEPEKIGTPSDAEAEPKKIVTPSDAETEQVGAEAVNQEEILDSARRKRKKAHASQETEPVLSLIHI